MLKNKKTLIFILIMVLILLFTFQNITFASNFKPEEWKPDITDDTKARDIAGVILGGITTVGSVVAVLALVIIGIRFMLGSVEEKAQYKESLKPYVLGAVLLFGILQIVKVLYDFGLGIV